MNKSTKETSINEILDALKADGKIITLVLDTPSGRPNSNQFYKGKITQVSSDVCIIDTNKFWSVIPLKHIAHISVSKEQ